MFKKAVNVEQLLDFKFRLIVKYINIRKIDHAVMMLTSYYFYLKDPIKCYILLFYTSNWCVHCIK